MNTKELGKTIKDRRCLLDIKQADLARISNISVHALSDIESGKGNPTLSTLHQVLDSLGLTLNIAIANVGDADA